VIGPVVARAGAHGGRRKEAPGLVGADASHREAGALRQLVDRQLLGAVLAHD